MTLGRDADRVIGRRAIKEALDLQVPFAPRRNRSLSRLVDEVADVLLVVRKHDVALVDRQGRLSFHEGMAHLRKLRLAAGGFDPLVATAGLRAGMTFLDTTLGLGRDSLVAAQVVGTNGQVVSLEASGARGIASRKKDGGTLARLWSSLVRHLLRN